MNDAGVTSVVIAGLGGQGVLTAARILADAALRAGYDVKQSELHGMSQRGGSVSCDVRFGSQVFSPMIPVGEADCLVVQSLDQVETNRATLAPDGLLLTCDDISAALLPNRKSLNVALLGRLSRHLPIPAEAWSAALESQLAAKLHEANRVAFAVGRGEES